MVWAMASSTKDSQVKDIVENRQTENTLSPFHSELASLNAGAIQDWRIQKTGATTLDSGFTPAVEIYDRAGRQQGGERLVAVADKQDKPGEVKSRDLFELVAGVKSDNLGPGMKMAQEATRDYLKDHDAATFTSKLEKAAGQTDVDYAGAVAAHWGDLNLARKNMVMHVTDFATKNQSLKETVEALPDDKQQTVKGLIGLAMAGQVSDEFKKSIASELKQYPDVASGLSGLIKSKEELGKAAEAMAKAEQPLLDAATEQAQSRYLQAQLKEQNGDKAEAYLMRQKAREDFDKTRSTIQGRPIEAKPLISV